MADRIPLIVDSSSNQVKELPAGDSIILADNENVKIGTGNDLLLYHDGTHSYIKEAGTGDLRIDGDSVRLREADGTIKYQFIKEPQNYIKMVPKD